MQTRTRHTRDAWWNLNVEISWNTCWTVLDQSLQGAATWWMRHRGLAAWHLLQDEFCWNESEASKFFFPKSFQWGFTVHLNFNRISFRVPSPINVIASYRFPFISKFVFPSGQARGMPCWCQSVRRILDKPGNFAISFRKERPSA